MGTVSGDEVKKAEAQLQADAAKDRERRQALSAMHLQWWTRQAYGILAMVRATLHPSVQPGSEEALQHEFKTLLLLCYKRAGELGVELEDVATHGKEIYEHAKAAMAKDEEIRKAAEGKPAETLMLGPDGKPAAQPEAV